MGACFNEMALDGKLTKEQVKAMFSERVEQDGYDHGRGGYSGSFYETNGLDFTGLEFDTEDAARDYLQEHAQKWEAALAVRHKVYDMPKSALNHDKARLKLNQKIWEAAAALRNAEQKARINNRSSKPSYVTKAEEKLEKVKMQVQPKIDERTAKIQAGINKSAAKSTKWVWRIGAWCSS